MKPKPLIKVAAVLAKREKALVRAAPLVAQITNIPSLSKISLKM